MVRVLRFREGGGAVLEREEAGVVVGDEDGGVFEGGGAEGEEVLDLRRGLLVGWNEWGVGYWEVGRRGIIILIKGIQEGGN